MEKACSDTLNAFFTYGSIELKSVYYPNYAHMLLHYEKYIKCNPGGMSLTPLNNGPTVQAL